MPFNFYDTHTLLMAVQQLTPAATFLRDRYFPTTDASDIFATDDVLVEFRDGSKKLAPFVAPRKGGVTVLRAGYNMERYTPPFVAPRRVLTLDELREMVGEPYWHVGLQKDSPPPHYTILPHHIAEHLEDYHYGEYWLAYRRKWSSQ